MPGDETRIIKGIYFDGTSRVPVPVQVDADGAIATSGGGDADGSRLVDIQAALPRPARLLSAIPAPPSIASSAVRLAPRRLTTKVIK